MPKRLSSLKTSPLDQISILPPCLPYGFPHKIRAAQSDPRDVHIFACIPIIQLPLLEDNANRVTVYSHYSFIFQRFLVYSLTCIWGRIRKLNHWYRWNKNDSMCLFWKVSCTQHIKPVKHKLMCSRDQLNLESYMYATIDVLRKTDWRAKLPENYQKKYIF